MKLPPTRHVNILFNSIQQVFKFEFLKFMILDILNHGIKIGDFNLILGNNEDNL